MPQANYHQLIFTTHARERMSLRRISPDTIRRVMSQPDVTFPSDKPDHIKFIRTLNQRKYHVIAAYLADKKKWLVISVWVRGETDPVPLTWQLITFPFKIIAKTARYITSYIIKYLPD